jgi:LuxR family maltose regulon positive regulatory protein
LYANASRWLAAHGLTADALQCAVEAGNWDLIVPLVLEQWRDTMLDGAPRPLDALPDIPVEVAHLDAAGAMAAAVLHVARGRAASTEARPLGYDADELSPDLRLVHDLLDYEFARRGPSPAALESAADVLFQWSLRHGELTVVSNRVAGLASRARAEAKLMAGDLPGAGEQLDSAIMFATAIADEQMTAAATASLALVTALSGRLRRAIALTDELGETWAISRSPSVQGTRALTFAICAYHADRLPAAQEALVEARTLLHGGAAADTVLPVVRARLATSLGDSDTAHRMLARAASNGRPALFAALRESFGLRANGRVVHRRGNDDAVEAGAPSHPYALALDDLAEATERHANGDQRGADDALDRAFAIAARHGYRRLFVDCGLPVRPLLRHYVASSHPFRLLASQQLERLQSDETSDQRAIVETLTERELTVLRYLPTMLSNREIAAEMYFSVNTVKTHLKSIYRKLDVTRRRDAVQRARTLSII